MAKKKEIKYRKGRNSRRLHSVDAFTVVVPFIMKERNDATNFFSDSLEISALERYIHRKRAEGMPGLGLLHLLVAAYVRTVSQMPALNRYIGGQRVYARKNIEYVMAVKKELRVDAPETTIKVIFEPTDTLETVYTKINAAVDAARNEGDTATDAVAGVIAKLPRFLFNAFVSAIKVMDYFNVMPKVIDRASPFHGSVIITDLGSLGIPPVFHHIYNFGNLPVFIGLGKKRTAYELDRKGIVRERRYVDFTIVTDERICDGFYFAQCFRMIRNCLRFPEQLEIPPERVVEDVY